MNNNSYERFSGQSARDCVLWESCASLWNTSTRTIFRKIFVDKPVNLVIVSTGTSSGLACGVSYLDRRPTARPAPLLLESLRSNESPKTFGLNIEHVPCVSVRGVYNWYPCETNALRFAEFSRQRASSRSRIARRLRSYELRPGPISNQLKALGISVITAGRGEQQDSKREVPCV